MPDYETVLLRERNDQLAQLSYELISLIEQTSNDFCVLVAQCTGLTDADYERLAAFYERFGKRVEALKGQVPDRSQRN